MALVGNANPERIPDSVLIIIAPARPFSRARTHRSIDEKGVRGDIAPDARPR
jgi:hypothetical protein